MVKDRTDGVPFVFVGNKADLAEKSREVSTETGQKQAKEWSCPFFEASALTKQNIQECFVSLAKETIASKAVEVVDRGGSDDSSPKGGFKERKRRGCALF